MIRSRTLSLTSAALAAALLFAACGSDGSKADQSQSSDRTQTAASAKGKPCVALADPLPENAPDVPIKVGPAPDTLIIEDLAPGTGTEVTADSTVVADYIGVACSTGKIFDASYSRGEPETFPLAQVIPGWQQGLLGMKVGGKRLLGIPSDQAYGPQGRDPIAPDEALWFVVEMRDVQAGPATTPPS